MKTYENLLLFAALLIAGVTSAQETETRKVPAFDKLGIGGSFDAVLRQGSESSVQITAENVADRSTLLPPPVRPYKATLYIRKEL